MVKPESLSGRRIAQRFSSRVRSMWSDERGISLVLALIVITTLSITSAGLSQLVTSNEHAYGRDRLEERAFNIAEAGASFSISKLSQLTSSAYGVNTAFGPTSFSIDNGTAQWTATKTAATPTLDTWTIVSKGTISGVSREVSVKITATKTSTSTQASLVWTNGFFVSDPSGCTNMVGSSSLTLPVFINADLCLNGSNSITEPNASGPKSVSLYVGGKLKIVGGPTVGTPTRLIKSANIVGGCLKNNAANACSNSAQSHVYADPPYLSTPSTLTKPPIDAPGTYAGGDWNGRVCSTGSFTFDNNGSRNTSVGTVDILTGSAYNCTVYTDASKTTVYGTLSWNPATKALAISGIIYIDGNLDFAGGDQATYTGFGSLYVNGTVTTNGNSAFCGPGATLNGSSCNGLWDGNLGAIAINVVNAGNSNPAWQMNGNAEFNVAAYVVGTFSESGTAKVTGPVVTDDATVAGTPDQTDLTNPPPGTPGAPGTSSTSTWNKVVPGSWQQLAAG